MKKIFSIVILLSLLIGSDLFSQSVPDLLYYRFENNPSPTTTPNFAIPGVGTNPAPLTTLTLTSGGQFDSCLTGIATGSAKITTGYNLSTGTSSFTISMWLNNLPAPASTRYLFGDVGNSFRCFVGGVAPVNGAIFRGTGITDVPINNIFPGPTVVHIVYDSASSSIKIYKNGVLDNTVVQTPLNITGGTGFSVGGYSSSAGLEGLMDEFRFYKRALSQAEITATWNHELPVVPPIGVVNPCRSGLNITIPDNNPVGVEDTIIVNVPGGGTILDVNVKIDTILHTFDADLDVTFKHGAIEDTLFHDVGSTGDNFIGTILNDSASTLIQSCNGVSGCAPFTGSYKPPNLLANLNGLPLNGNYILRMVDDLGGDIGTLKGWCITVTYTTVTGTVETISIPSKYSLSQNYPNPFNPTTSIKFNLPKSSDVKLVVYDMLGREVRTLVNEFKQAGNHIVDFNASALSSGSYFYRITAGEFTDTKRMILLK